MTDVSASNGSSSLGEDSTSYHESYRIDDSDSEDEENAVENASQLNELREVLLVLFN